MTKMMRRAAPLALLLALGGAFCAAQEPGNCTVVGTLVVSGSPLEGARIVASSSAASDWEAEAVTGADGGFLLSGVPVGVLWLKAYDDDDGLTAAAEGELSEDGETLELDLTG